MKGQMIKKGIVIMISLSFHKISQKIKLLNLETFSIIFKNANVWEKFQPHCEDPSHFTRHSDLLCLPMKGGKSSTQVKLSIKTFSG